MNISFFQTTQATQTSNIESYISSESGSQTR